MLFEQHGSPPSTHSRERLHPFRNRRSLLVHAWFQAIAAEDRFVQAALSVPRPEETGMLDIQASQ